jgi:Protein of unknown function (DUF1257)
MITSHYATVETNFQDVDCLVEALEELNENWTDRIEVHDQPQTLYGYHGDARPEKAEIVIRRKYISSVSNDIGFVRGQSGKFGAIISEYDSGHYNQEWLGKLKQTYAKQTMRKKAKASGLRIVSEIKQANGSLELVMESL